MKFVISGTGRCGTGYVSELLNRAGIPTGHESIFTLDGYEPCSPLEELVRFGPFSGDSSWLSAPYLDSFDGVIIHLIRDRQATIQSFENIGFFNPRIPHGRYREFARQHAPGADTPEVFYETWNNMIKPYADLTWGTEEINRDDILALLDLIDMEEAPTKSAIDDALLSTSKTVNTRPKV